MLTRRLLRPALFLGVVLAGLIALVAMGVRAASADEPCGDDTCAVADDFETSVDDWTANNESGTAVWLPSQEFTKTCQWWEFSCLPWLSSGAGIMKVTFKNAFDPALPVTTLQKFITLSPGTYRIEVRFASQPKDVLDPYAASARVSVTYNNTTAPVLQGKYWINPTWQFGVYSTDSFVVDRETAAKVQLDLVFRNDPIFFDRIWVIRESTDYPTPNPALPTLPAYATPIPMPTEVCRRLQDPTPLPFSLTPTAAPSTADVYIHESFTVFTNAKWVPFPDQSEGIEWDSMSRGDKTRVGSVIMRASLSADEPPERAALGFVTSEPITAPVYINGFVSNLSPIPQGVTANVEVWAMDDTDTWSLIQTHAVSWGAWQPIHTAINSGVVRALALAFSRTDGNTTDQIRLDDITVYTNFAERPYCTDDWVRAELDPDSRPQDESYSFSVPLDRDCPDDLLVPNNFWGPLLAGLTQFLDTLTAPFPGHKPGSTTLAARELSQAPVWNFLAIIASIWDLRPLIAAAGTIIAIEAVRAIWSLWIFIKKTTPFL